MAAITVFPPFVRSAFLALLFCLAMAFTFAGCAHQEKTGMDAEGEPIEHKVFYKGWGWSKDD